ncbi:MAG: trans-2-enoyl-CoA reductase [Gammaproteobacteria bacterium 39-13]|nr:trans-2-enoyl-CoA reductase family protein [Gammaproteobacteria bacterium]OJV88366.1 MAG: trans-2-enoyl-CoA reductase [Gammaproteobacteria bacterium 39-13]
MIIQPKIRGFICTTAHPLGCKQNVLDQIQYVKQHAKMKAAPKKVLVIGASTGYGLASRIAAAFGSQAQTIGVFFEKAAEGKRTASTGWYNSAAFEDAAHQAGLYAKSVNGDAFSDEIKEQTIRLIQQDWQGEVDLVIYSLASPRRTDPRTGQTFNSVLKPIGQKYTSKTVDVMTGQVSDISIDPASSQEIENTVAVMGGEDWERWMDALLKANVLAKGAMTVAYSYIGPELTYPIYREGTIGKAKAHLEETAKVLTQKLAELHGHAYVSVNKALVTQASAAIPVVPLYISLLYKIMKEQNLHEGCIEQITRLYNDSLYSGHQPAVDDKGLIRLDDWEMKPEVQSKVNALWNELNSENINSLTDLKGYRHEFHQLFGFESPNVDYTADVEPDVQIPSLEVEQV